MLSSDENENKPIGKVSQRKTKAELAKKREPGKKAEGAKKSEPRKRKDAQPATKPDQLLEALQRLGAPENDPIVAPVTAGAPVMPPESSQGETTLAETTPVAVAEPADAIPVSLQTIADAYGDYSKKSLEQTSSFVAKLAGTRSFVNAFELQTTFAREAYETFVEQSRRIRDLHREMAKQRLTKLEGFVMGKTRAR